MRYVIAFFFPWLSLFLQGKVLSGIICLILQLTLIGWIPAFMGRNGAKPHVCRQAHQ